MLFLSSFCNFIYLQYLINVWLLYKSQFSRKEKIVKMEKKAFCVIVLHNKEKRISNTTCSSCGRLDLQNERSRSFKVRTMLSFATHKIDTAICANMYAYIFPLIYRLISFSWYRWLNISFTGVFIVTFPHDI